ncbi:hypothetical protein V5799_010903 [Amblyomma americanum]|uniref:Uncharacterized protein n=1 Tax=Amblyomma americanum TaxID=6943 RepID=A0AAQ4EIE5_AMBAM
MQAPHLVTTRSGGAESTSKPASAVAASGLSTLTRQPTQIDEASAPTARRLIFTMSKGLFSTQLIPQFVCEAVRPTPTPPDVKQGDPEAKLPLELQADLPVAAKKEEMLCSDDTSRRYHDDRVHAVRACRVQDGESTSSECQDSNSSPAKRSQVNSRRPPPEARPLSVESARALVDDKLPSVNAERASLDSSHPLIPAGEPRAQQSGSKAPERSVLATSKKAETAGAGKSSKRPSTVEGPPPPPPNADAIAASTRAAASAKAGMKRRGSILPTPIAQPHPTRKPSWWSAFATVDEFSRRRRKMSTFSDFLTSCLVLLVLVTVAGALLFFTFRLAQILYRPVPQPNIGRPITTENATKTAASSATTIAPTV